MIDKNFEKEINMVVNKLPVNYRILTKEPEFDNTIVKVDEFLSYKSSKTRCYHFYKPVSKLFNEEGNI